jgi:branched-subunit amino acid transport protein AzlD
MDPKNDNPTGTLKAMIGLMLIWLAVFADARSGMMSHLMDGALIAGGVTLLVPYTLKQVDWASYTRRAAYAGAALMFALAVILDSMFYLFSFMSDFITIAAGTILLYFAVGRREG